MDPKLNRTIRDAYISVEINDRALETLREGLRSLFDGSGVECEIASGASHVSIAYGQGDIEVEALDRVASEIAALPFSVQVAGFELLRGEATPYDYLVVVLEGSSFGAAHSKASGCMRTREFEGGFRSHLSLLKFPKGAVPQRWVSNVLAEMNVCQAAARALGRPGVALKGAAVSVFGSDRRCRLSKAFIAA